MERHTFFDELEAHGMIDTSRKAIWEDASNLLSVIDMVGRRGSSVVVKVDGARDNNLIYTVVISGGLLGEDFFRKDGVDLKTLLEEAISFYCHRALPKNV